MKGESIGAEVVFPIQDEPVVDSVQALETIFESAEITALKMSHFSLADQLILRSSDRAGIAQIDAPELPKSEITPNGTTEKNDVDIALDTSAFGTKTSTDNTNKNTLLTHAARSYVAQTPGLRIRTGIFGIRTKNRKVGRSINAYSSDDTVKDYLNNIGNFELLDTKAEKELAGKMREGRVATLKMILDGMRVAFGMNAQFSQEEKDPQLLIRGLEAKDHFFHANLRLVVSIAKRYQNRGLELIELIQEGNLGLDHALDMYDADKGFKFSTYAVWWIKQSITRAINDKGQIIRLPLHTADKAPDIIKSYTEENKSIEEINASTGINRDIIQGVITARTSLKSLDDYVGDDQSARFGDFVEDSKAAFGYKEIEQLDIRSQLLKVLFEVLGNREANIMIYRYGLDREDGVSRSVNEVSQYFSLSRERIRQLEFRALGILRHPASKRYVGKLAVFFEPSD